MANNRSVRTREPKNEKPTPKKKVVSPTKRTNHHRKPRSAGGKGKREGNISSVRHVDHVAYHRLFGPGLPEVIASIINEIWIDPEYELVVRKRRHPVTKNTNHRSVPPKK